MSGLWGAIAGAADSASGILGQRIKADAESRARNEQAAIEERLQAARELRMEAAQQRMDQYKRSQSAKLASDISAKSTGILNDSDASAINAQFGSSMTAEDAKVLENNPAARKAYGLEDNDTTARLRREIQAGDSIGATDFANERRKTLDTERRFISDEKRDTRAADETERRATRDDRLDKYNERRADRQDKIAEANLAFQQNRIGKDDARAEINDAKERRAATATALKGAQTDLDNLGRELKATFKEEEKKAISAQMSALRKEAEGYRKLLAGAGIESPTPNATGRPSAADFAPKPAPRNAATAPATSPAATPRPGILASSGDEYLAKATITQLYAALNGADSMMAKVAKEELKRRGLLQDAGLAPTGKNYMDGG